MNYLLAALFSAFFAALTAIFAKIGLEGVDSNLATAVRTSIVVVLTWLIVIFQKGPVALGQLSRKTWLFLVLSALATGASWLFYFYALKVGEARKVVPIDKLSLVLALVLAGIFLREKLTFQVALGAGLVTLGAILIGLAK